LILKPIPRPLKTLSDEGYIRQRLTPSRFDRDYLHLADLLQLIRRIAPEVRGSVFDYGSGGAPYAPLFSNCSAYVAADLVPGPKVDRVLGSDGMTQEAANSCDFVLSSQVLEHVKNPRLYLLESLRILRPGGRILVTTHGMVIEHGCPHDFQRWTVGGLEELFREVGFEIIQSGKLTTQIRGIVQLMHMFAPQLRHPNKPGLHIILSIIRKLYLAALVPLLNTFADLLKEQAMVGASASDCIYVGIFVHGQKPAVSKMPAL